MNYEVAALNSFLTLVNVLFASFSDALTFS